MPKYELTDDVIETLGNQGANIRDHMVCRHARFLLEGKPHYDELFGEGTIQGPFNWKGEDKSPGLTVCEIEAGQRLARKLKPIYLEEQRVAAEAQAAKEKMEKKVSELSVKKDTK